MRNRRIPWEWLIALIVGFGLGLAYAWIIAPVEYVDAEPHLLRADFKDHFRSAIAAAYASTADLERARARLALLGDTDPAQALSAQAQRMLAVDESPEVIQQVALLASALQGGNAPSPQVAVSFTPPNTQEASTQPTSNAAIAATFETTMTGEPTGEPTATPIPLQTATPRPSRTPTPTLGAPYQLVGQDTLCEPELAEGLLQIVVTDARRQQIPGAEIIITWSGGEEHIFTGLKPELGHGYADFLMTPDVIYSVRMADGGTPASEVSTPTCTAAGGSSYIGGYRITFQQP
jgi:hypothetical protein